jgi:hypothetical protein
MRRMVLFFIGALIAPPLVAQSEPRGLVIAGAGFGGAWDTEIEFANTQPVPVPVSIFILGLPLGAPCPPNCTSTGATLPPNGTVRLLASDFIGESYLGPQMVRVTTEQEAALPVVRARVFNRERPSQSAELPVNRDSTLQSLDPAVLVFPGVHRSAGLYSNLILELVGLGSVEPTEVLVEVFSPEGTLLGSGRFFVPSETTFHALTLQDVAGRLGVARLEGGQVRVTKLSGEAGALWGVLSTMTEGRLSVSVGANP